METDLLKTTHPLTQQEALDWMEEHGLHGETGEFQIGDTIKFIGIDTDDKLYVIWDCYWFPIDPTDTTRNIQKI